jgi:hypothetical protein
MEISVLKAITLCFGLMMGVTAASAGILPAPASSDNGAVVRVAEKCGAGWYAYGPDKRCHKFTTPYGTDRGTVIACPPGMHIGPEGHYCWPN